jgi:hypothetical protein
MSVWSVRVCVCACVCSSGDYPSVFALQQAHTYLFIHSKLQERWLAFTCAVTRLFTAEADCLRICRQCCDWPLGFVHHGTFVRDVGQHSKWKRQTYFARKIWFQTERIFAKAYTHAVETTVIQPSIKALTNTIVRLMVNEDVNSQSIFASLWRQHI